MDRSKNSYVVNQLCDAFLSLMQEKKYTEISVTDVVKRAQVARASFYRNFSSTEDILDLITESGSQFFMDQIIPILEDTDEKQLENLLLHAVNNFGQAIQPLSEVDPENITAIVSRITRRVQASQEEKCFESVEETYRLAAKFAVIIHVLNLWTYRKKKESPEEIAQCILSYLRRL